MSSSISATSGNDVASAAISKPDAQQKGAVDAAALKAGPDQGADNAKAAQAAKPPENDNGGRVTKSELSVAIDKVGNELSAQLDQSRLNAASAPPAAKEQARVAEADNADKVAATEAAKASAQAAAYARQEEAQRSAAVKVSA